MGRKILFVSIENAVDIAFFNLHLGNVALPSEILTSFKNMVLYYAYSLYYEISNIWMGRASKFIVALSCSDHAAYN